jgi:hypothetical protein
MTGLPWDASYHDGPAPWDVGGPQLAIVRLASEGGFTGTVLDAGCGTGENAVHVASLPPDRFLMYITSQFSDTDRNTN